MDPLHTSSLVEPIAIDGRVITIRNVYLDIMPEHVGSIFAS